MLDSSHLGELKQQVLVLSHYVRWPPIHNLRQLRSLSIQRASAVFNLLAASEGALNRSLRAVPSGESKFADVMLLTSLLPLLDLHSLTLRPTAPERYS